MISFLNPTIRQRIEQATSADSSLCWNCSSCDAECPVEIATNRLRLQRVDGCGMIASLRELAVREGQVEEGFVRRVRDAQKQIFARLLDEIDELLGLNVGFGNQASCPVALAECV